MLFTLYPNNELRARIPQAKRSRLGDSSSSRYALVNSAKVAISFLPPIELCKFPSCTWPRRGYGGEPKPVDFSERAKKILSRAGGLFSAPTERRTVFFTGTLPGSTDRAVRAFALHSSWVIHEFFSRFAQSSKIPSASVRFEWVWEFQKRGALHFHLCYEFPSKELARKFRKLFRRVWKSVLRGVAARSGVDIFEKSGGKTWRNRERYWRTDCQFVRKSVSAYLAKYLSKTSGRDTDRSLVHPTRWYGCSRFLLKELGRKIIQYVTHSSASQKGNPFSEWDAPVLEVLKSCSSAFYSYKDKYGSGCGYVMYLMLDFVADVKDFLSQVQEEFMGSRPKVKRVKYVSRVGPRPVRLSNFELLLSKSWMVAGFMEFLAGDEVEAFTTYVEDGYIDLSILVVLDGLARKYLYYAGYLTESREPKASVAALDGPVESDTGRVGGEYTQLTLDDIPF